MLQLTAVGCLWPLEGKREHLRRVQVIILFPCITLPVPINDQTWLKKKTPSSLRLFFWDGEGVINSEQRSDQLSSEPEVLQPVQEFHTR